MRRLLPMALVAFGFAPAARADLKISDRGDSAAACARGGRVVAAYRHGAGRAGKEIGEPLDETRGMGVIEAELRAAGLAPERGLMRLVSVVEEVTTHAYHVGESGQNYCVEGREELPQIVHGFDARAGVGYVFVTAAHAGNLTIAGVRARGPIDLARIAAAVARAAAAETKPRHLGVFYDPLTVEACEGQKCHARAEELLRAQVRDFVACLRAAGAI